MKDYLEGLEIKEGQSKLTDEQIKGILAENGKIIKTEQEKIIQSNKEEIESYKNTIAKLESQIEEMPSSEEMDKLKNEIEAFKTAENERIAKEKAQKEDEILTNNILASIGDKKFTSDYVKNGILADVKTELKKQENIGKGIDKIVEELTKDIEGIFVNPNKAVEIPPMGNENITDVKEGNSISVNTKFKTFNI